MKTRTRHVWSAVRGAVGLGLLYYVFASSQSWPMGQWAASRPWLLLGWVALPLAGGTVESLRLRTLLRSQAVTISIGEGWRLAAIGTFFSYCIPGGTGGDVMKLYCLTRERSVSVLSMAAVLVVDRFVALFSLLLLIAALASVSGDAIGGSATIRSLVVVVGCGVLGMGVASIVMFSRNPRAMQVYGWLTTNRLAAKAPLARHIKNVSNAVAAFRGDRWALVAAGLWSLLGHALLTAMFVATGAALFPEAPSRVVALLALLAMLANALPITPAGLGVGEAAFDTLFRLAGFLGGASLILAWRIGSLPLVVIGGMYYVVGSRRRPSTVANGNVANGNSAGAGAAICCGSDADDAAAIVTSAVEPFSSARCSVAAPHSALGRGELV